MSFWNDLIRSKAEDWLFYPFAKNQVAGSEEPRDLAPGQEYMNIFLKSARVVNVRSGLKKFYGAVHSFMTIPLQGQPTPGQVTTVTTPSLLKNVDPRRIDRVVSINHRLLGPIPAPSGDTKLELGLFSIEEEDLVAPYLGLLETFSGLAGVGFIKGAVPFIGPIKDGINGILHGQGDTLLEIGIATTFNPVRTGYFLVMRVPRDEIDPSTLVLDVNDWKVVGTDGKRVKDYPYLVFEISATKEKGDWASIPELHAQYNLIRDAVRRGDAKEANSNFDVFSRVAQTCFDLTSNDAIKLVAKVRAEIDSVLGSPSGHAQSSLNLRDFGQVALYNE
ncbi:MAG: hypothetical protein R3F13_15010 [Prosthecobacter sp.]